MTEFVSTTRGDRVAYDAHGEGPALVFVAGAGPFRAEDPVTTETARLAGENGVTAVVFDRLGRGETETGGDADLDAELGALSALLEHVGGSAVLCGHSSGCSIALRAAAAGLPVDGLVLWEAPVSAPAAETAEWASDFERQVEDGDLEAATETYMRDMPPEWLAGAKASPAWPDIAASARSKVADAQSLAWATAVLEDGSLADDVKVPVVAVYGTETFPGMPEAAERIADALPGATVAEVPGSGHSWEPEAMADVLVKFVRTATGSYEHPTGGV
ncbi:alpha/beta fold hydrolase [Phycicoccus flavus]|uniref:Alpha/beta hydrolase n=1 Tax=Phycicoccus flavus TaxID=2502783 RepID=A0A8T6R4D3_9MICO|nr:alpha/beta hydrolase [Phycicoccus flavus]NHA68847.1 alpha/beta hydrolase [Phycicoccus flavus]